MYVFFYHYCAKLFILFNRISPKFVNEKKSCCLLEESQLNEIVFSLIWTI